MDTTDTVIFERVGDPAPGSPIGPAEPDRDLSAAVAAAAPRRWWNRGTIVLAGLLLVMVGFLTGTQVQQRWGDTPATGIGRTGGFPGTLPSGFPGGGMGRGEPGSGSAPTSDAAATTGKVKLVDAGVLYLETSDGTVVTVRTNDRTSVQTSRKSELAKLKAGQTVSVQGDRSADGTVTATTVTAAG
ncbi:DUF5666 domain-containing protein [Micromonospora narathiwatensis]|uniref:DUF5666 domain-containing protein n=1 Tax=Micromonospora narathiwatensis TaxID=299146 RepID=A0A1A8ZJ66_9ACTN|nr:DUF5666 domain-containing protein [Micromonospora narathiwatensis]SBT43884.1 hypothetical protein GA0070621_1913 [Micromonospora narathiwatensis]